MHDQGLILLFQQVRQTGHPLRLQRHPDINAHSQHPAQAAAGYELVPVEPPDVMAISSMRCEKPFSLAGIAVASAVGSSAIA
jgi:hypothetical protein